MYREREVGRMVVAGEWVKDRQTDSARGEP